MQRNQAGSSVSEMSHQNTPGVDAHASGISGECYMSGSNAVLQDTMYVLTFRGLVLGVGCAHLW